MDLLQHLVYHSMAGAPRFVARLVVLLLIIIITILIILTPPQLEMNE